MEICLLADRPGHPILDAMLAEAGRRHRTRLLIPTDDVGTQEGFAAELRAPADLYLLKSRSELGLDLAQALEREGVRVVNTAAATFRCRDRVAMARALDAAEIPSPRTLAVGTVCDVIRSVTPPAMVKSRLSRRGDLVVKVASPPELDALASSWPDEHVLVQDVSRGDGWDYKAWVIGADVHMRRRLSSLATGAVGDEKRNYPIADPVVEGEVRELALAVGRAFELELFGIDVILGAGGMSIVDVNAFPGFRGVPRAPGKLAAYAERVVCGASNAP
jgi:ribosomal protein S6--L-glutamate ligase